MISAEAPIVFAKACEFFIEELTLRAWTQAEENKRRTLQKSDIAAAVSKSDMYDFLIDIVPRDLETLKSATTKKNDDYYIGGATGGAADSAASFNSYYNGNGFPSAHAADAFVNAQAVSSAGTAVQGSLSVPSSAHPSTNPNGVINSSTNNAAVAAAAAAAAFGAYNFGNYNQAAHGHSADYGDHP